MPQFSPCSPCSAFVLGVNSGFSNAWLSFIPSGTLIPCTVPCFLYSDQALPVMYPRTIASTGKIFSFLTTILRSLSWSAYCFTASGRKLTEEEMKWFGQTPESTLVNQNSERAVSNLPLFGMPYKSQLNDAERDAGRKVHSP
jgi:hypothetical protein